MRLLNTEHLPVKQQPGQEQKENNKELGQNHSTSSTTTTRSHYLFATIHMSRPTSPKQYDDLTGQEQGISPVYTVLRSMFVSIVLVHFYRRSTCYLYF